MSSEAQSPQTGPTVRSTGPSPATENGDDPSEISISREEAFEVLSNERRRLVLRYLRDHGGTRVDFREVVDRVAAWENDVPSERLDSSDRKCVYSALRQTHLPKLDKLGVVEFDHSRGQLTLNDGGEEVFRYMAYSPRRMRRWNRLYLGLAGASVAGALLIELGVPPFGNVPTITAVIGVAAAFAVASIARLYRTSHYIVEHDGAATVDGSAARASGYRQVRRQVGAALGGTADRLADLRPSVHSWYVIALRSTPGLHPYGRKRNVLVILLYLIAGSIIAGFVV